MLRSKDGDFFFSNWLRNRNTVEFLGIWEKVNNPDFNYAEFDTIKSKAGLNNFRLSAKEWMEKTHAIGIVSKAGRYGGTYAHKDIAFEFAMWISPEFKVYLIREFQRLIKKRPAFSGRAFFLCCKLTLLRELLLQVVPRPWGLLPWGHRPSWRGCGGWSSWLL